MGRRKLGQRNIRKLTRIGNKSYGITLPIEVIREFKWRERQKLELVVDKKKKEIKIKDWKK